MFDNSTKVRLSYFNIPVPLKGAEIIQKPRFRGVLRKRCSENMQQIYRRTYMPKCDFNNIAKFITLFGKL